MDEFLEKYTKVPKEQRFLAFVALMILVVVGYWFLIHSGVNDTAKSLEVKKKKLEVQRVAQNNKKKDLKLYETKLRQLEEDLSRARAQLPDEADVAQLVSQLGNKGRQSGLTIKKIDPNQQKSQGFYAEIPFLVNLSGSYHEIATFIDSLGKLERIVNVSDIALTRPKLENSKMMLEGAMTVRTYRYLKESERPAPAKGKKKKKRRR